VSCSATGRDSCNNREQSAIHDSRGLWAIRFAETLAFRSVEQADARPAANASSIIASGRSCESLLEANARCYRERGIAARSHDASALTRHNAGEWIESLGNKQVK